ncbi:MAG TPA: carbon monoxide dehydrogenase subunit G [Chloroflexota bacterium]|nr:carbon monoxide dehydrogenase subunit G [Chloroflexota bacterium]
MKINGAHTFAAPTEVVWPMLLDPHILASVMPGCEKLEQVAENEYQGILKIKVGPVQGNFNGNILLSDIQSPESYAIVVDGKGAPGFVKGHGRLRLEASGDSIILHYEGDAQVGGRLASVGQRLLDTSANAIIRQSLEGLEAQIAARMNGNGEVAGETAVETSPPTQTEFALGVARHMVEEMLADEEQAAFIRKVVIGAGALFILYILLDWFAGRIASKVAKKIK